jgi:hypothetical protein
MAQSTLHLSFGMGMGMLGALPPLWSAWRQHRALAKHLARWCIVSYGLGVYAVIPAIIRRLADNPEIGNGVVWNLFLLFPLFDTLNLPSMAIGEMAVGGLFAVQYVTILLAIQRARRMAASRG